MDLVVRVAKFSIISIIGVLLVFPLATILLVAVGLLITFLIVVSITAAILALPLGILNQSYKRTLGSK